MGLFGSKNSGSGTSKDDLRRQLIKIGNECPEINIFTMSIADKLKTGLDDFGVPVVYSEMAIMVDTILVKMARSNNYERAVPKLKSIAQEIRKL